MRLLVRLRRDARQLGVRAALERVRQVHVVRVEQELPHEHAGSVRATDAAHALQNARDVYGRRGKVISMWVVPTGAIAATSPSDAGPYFDPMNERPYVHPHFYKAPRGVRGL